MQILPITTTQQTFNPVHFRGKAILDEGCRRLAEHDSAFREKISSLERSECGFFHVTKGESRGNGWGDNTSEIRLTDNYGESRRIGSSRFFETLGKGTLLVYLWNGLINRLILSAIPIRHIYNGGSVLSCVLFHSLVFTLLLLAFYLLIKAFYSTKFLSWMVGKW